MRKNNIDKTLWTALALLALLLLPVHAEPTGKLYVVGMGPAGADLAAPRALSIVEKADYLLCSPGMPKRFDRFGVHIDPSKVAFNPWETDSENEPKKESPQSRQAAREKQREKIQKFVMEKINAGKTVAIMNGGDPCIYGPALSHLLTGMDDKYYEVVPGMSALNAAAAALKRSLTCKESRFVMLTSPQSLFGEKGKPEDDILRDLASYKTTMVMYMSLRRMGKLVEKFKPYFPEDLPVAVVYFAGYPDKEFVLKSSLANIEADIKKMDEQWLGLVVMGDCIK